MENNNEVNEIKKAIKIASDKWLEGLDERFNYFMASAFATKEVNPSYEKLKADNEVLLNALKVVNTSLFNKLVAEQIKDGCSKGYSEDYVSRQSIIKMAQSAIKQCESK